MSRKFDTKDSGERAEYKSGMVRDTEAGKARFDLLFPVGVPYAEQMMTRFADLMARGAEKYDERNWEKARGYEELSRYKSSALRHLIQWMSDEDDEDHAAAVMFNLLAGETVKYREQAAFDVLPPLGREEWSSYASDFTVDEWDREACCSPECGWCHPEDMCDTGCESLAHGKEVSTLPPEGPSSYSPIAKSDSTPFTVNTQTAITQTEADNGPEIC